MARLSLSLLGALQFLRDGQPISGFAYNKARALLAYLAVEADRPHHRDALVWLLWPDLPDAAARANLRQVLADLRQVLGDARATPPFLLITRESIQLNPAGDYQLDVNDYVALLDACAAHTHRHPERCRSCAARMGQALALYRGDFLAGFSVGDSAPFEEWQLRQRERLHQQALDALARLASYHERRGEDELARRYAQRLLELEPWREQAHRQLMRLLARGGQRSAALAQYEACRRTLARDLGVEPEAETSALYEQIRDGESGRKGERESTRAYSSSPALPGSHSSRRDFPAQTTPLIGREAELVELGALLENPAHRLITVVGPGGIGKTRLALAAAAEQAWVFTHGAMFVALQAISSAAFLAPAILAALDIPLQGQREPREQLLDYLREKELLLLLDNFEQLLAPDQSENGGGAVLLVEILQHAPGVTLLVTSRERLALPGEWLFDLAGLGYPAGHMANGVADYDAVQLFMQRARQVRRQFTLADGEARAVARICRLVEGLPLAIELAAAALRTRSCAAIAAEIESSVKTLSSELRAIPERQRSMWATFEHSWRLLSEEERQVFARLSVFRGGFDEDAAAQVAQATSQLLASLVDKSLLRWDSVARYDLHELMRQYAGEKLEQAGEAEVLQRQHALYFLISAETTAPELIHTDRLEWLEANHANLRAALAWAVNQRDAEIALRLGVALGSFWWTHGYQHEGRQWLEAILTASSVRPKHPDQAKLWSSVRASALEAAGLMAWACGYYDQATIRHAQCLALAQELQSRAFMCRSLSNLGMAELYQGDHGRATALLIEALAQARELGETRLILLPLINLGIIAGYQGDHARAETLLAESLAGAQDEADLALTAWSLRGLGMIAWLQDDQGRATALYIESLTLSRKLDDWWGMTECIEGLARTSYSQGQASDSQPQLARAARLLGAAVALRLSTGNPMLSAYRITLERAVASTRAQLGEPAFAAAWAAGRAMRLDQAIGYALEGSESDSAAPIATAASG